ncbi:hypothetical protein GPL21_33455 [Bradyrhizobium pachyrhizi]|uniref:Uncharacterized protein n=1 Tax=Bradyrhizobium pachyrhizi TaxID=280333 RepID=A0A844T387_9BRAD|nr:hypothetical protein [Bradyrhizobium pachyrhizi]MVT69992.1 hypothetical protein [Bradyrhizobium pachyrhizi]
MVATVIAGFAPTVGTAIAAPAPSAALAAAAESPALLALGVELDERQAAYRAAAACLEKARTVAAELWPEPPAAIVIKTSCEQDLFEGDFEHAEGFEGERLYRDVVGTDGKTYPNAVRLLVLKSDRLQQFLAQVRDSPDAWGSDEDRQKLEADLTAQIAAAKRYEAACANAIATSGITAAKEAAHDRASAVYALLFEVRKHVPRTVAGMLILARAIAAFDEAQPNYAGGGERAGGHILGRELANAVLRVAATTA